MNEFSKQDQQWMEYALSLADQASTHGEVPVGAVLVQDGKVIGQGFNQPIAKQDATAHAEIIAIREACRAQENYRLPKAELFVTLEPCAMCAGAIVHARIARVVIAATEPRAGAAGSVLNVLDNASLNHQCDINIGLLQAQSARRLKGFFASRRQKKRSKIA